MYQLNPGSWISPLLMIVGSVTILLAVAMALVQKDFKRLLSYHAISQVGYMVLGIGTALPIGIVGGIFHMINHAMYKSCLFLTGGAVEKQTGTTDLAKLGGIGRKMPVTFICFIIAAAAISGVPPLNGFFSKEMVYDASLERNVLFYVAALLGSFLTAASFLKLGHSAFLGKRDPSNDRVKEAPLSMLVPMVVIAGMCVLFGVCNWLPLNNLVEPVVRQAGRMGSATTFAGWPLSTMLVVLTCVSLIGALVNHVIGAKLTGSGLHAVDHVQYAPGLGTIYDKAGKRWFDPYDIGLTIVGGIAFVAWKIDRAIDWLYDGLTVFVTYTLGKGVRMAHTGNYALYILWAVVGAAAVLIYLAAA
jgi:NADH-quinone oxidoreductase subunit L